MSSDSVIATFNGWVSTADLIAQLPAREVERFEQIGYTIGGVMVFASNRVDRKLTINMARGMNRTTIADRMDLTLECIRRYYTGDTDTPLGATLTLYENFFRLFGGFNGYVDFFLLQELVTDEWPPTGAPPRVTFPPHSSAEGSTSLPPDCSRCWSPRERQRPSP